MKKMCLVLRNHTCSYPYAIKFSADEKVRATRKKSEWPGWIWCVNTDSQGGWIPAKNLRGTGNSRTVIFDYSTAELSADKFEILEILEEESGWLRCKSGSGKLGWIPSDNVVKYGRKGRLPIKIRDIEPDLDLSQMIQIAESLPQWFTQKGIAIMAKDFLFQEGLVVTVKSEITGFITYFVYNGICNIGWMGIIPSLQRLGIGRLLIEELFRKLQAFGISEFHVETLGDSVDYEPYEQTRAFYRKIGFRDFERIKQDNPEWPEKLILSITI